MIDALPYVLKVAGRGVLTAPFRLRPLEISEQDLHETIIALDPGPTMSAAVHYHPVECRVLSSVFIENDFMLGWLHEMQTGGQSRQLAIEMFSSYGMPVGREVFETCIWIGRFIQAWEPDKAQLLYRQDIKLHLCGSSRAKDPNVRAALMDRFGGSLALGIKRRPGPLYGVSGHKWAALAVAVCFAESKRRGRDE